MRTALATGAVVTALLATGTARADEPDGFYGRFEGDLELRVHAGAAFAAGGPALAAGVSALYLSTAGIYAHYTDAVGSDAPAVARSISTGVRLAPLFLARLAVDAERGPALLDLFIDSLAFELGAVWTAPRPPMGAASLDEHPGLEAALNLDVPLFPRATGPFIGVRGAFRWRPGDFAPGAPTTFVDRGAVLSLTLGWRHIVNTHLVDPGDRVAR